MNIKRLIEETVVTDWKDVLIELLKPYEDTINSKLANYDEAKIFPEKQLIFNCFNYFNINELKCLIIGQDCYHTRGVANGLCFSHNFQKNNKIQPSLRNIFKEVQRTENVVRVNSDLSDWAKQGCLMLNMSLTVMEGIPNSHANIWLDYIHDVVKWIGKNCNNICVMLWGNFAQSTEKYFNNTNTILKAGHPSPLNTKNPFIGCDHFKLCSKIHDIKWA